MPWFDAHAYPTTGAFLRDGPAHGAGCVVADADDTGFADHDFPARLQAHGISLPTILTSSRPAGRRAADWHRSRVTWLEKPFSPEGLLRCVGQAIGDTLV